MKKQRIDIFLVENDYFNNIENAKKAIMAGLIFINNERAANASVLVSESSSIIVREQSPKFVSRAGFKLEHGLNYFNINLKNQICLDIGSSTGGFTHCMLQYGATKVYCVDVGYNQLAWKLRNDKRVIIIEKTNFRYLDITKIIDTINFVTIDVSFISITKLIDKLQEIINNDTEIVCLIKPQFESKYNEVINGVVNDQNIHFRIINELVNFFINKQLSIINFTYSPILGMKKSNIEYLIHLKNQPKLSKEIDFKKIITIAWNTLKNK